MRFGLTSICQEDAVSDYDLFESEIEELYQKPEEPKVELTIDEAKEILWDLRVLYKQTYGCEWVKNEPWLDEFKKRIEKAEGK